MTTTQYYAASFLKIFGFQRKNTWLTSASKEAHLLDEAEEILGELAWEYFENDTENDALYWKIKSFLTQRAQLSKSIQELESEAEELQQSRHAALANIEESSLSLERNRGKLTEQESSIYSKINDLSSQASQLKKERDGINSKLSFLASEEELTEEIKENSHREMLRLKNSFQELKKEKEKQEVLLLEIQKEISTTLTKITHIQEPHAKKAQSLFTKTSELNKILSEKKNIRSSLQKECRETFIKVGQILSHPDNKAHPGSRAHSGLIKQMKAIRKSIFYQQSAAQLH